VHGLTIIGFVGSVFSPYYAWARGRGGGIAAPENHVALNVAVYGPRRAWAMTERGPEALARSAGRFTVGPSSMAWDGTTLTVAFDERSCPLPRRVRGTVRLIPEGLGTETFMLDTRGRHRWTPLGPRSRIEVMLENPSLRWSGHGYLDTNIGDEPVESGFSRWDWARASAGYEAAILYDAMRRDGSRLSLALAVRQDGTVARRDMPAPAQLPPTRIWRIGRATHGEGARVAATLEDTPFYARSVVTSRLFGREATAVHESLDLDRFSSRWVRALLPFRMPRRA
jgi:carotenoid 1,2-hydratase